MKKVIIPFVLALVWARTVLAADAGERQQLPESAAESGRAHVAWAQDWVPPNIGWESEEAAYRCYWGQFDFFGKKRPQLIYPTLNAAENYHGEQAWGMDALHVDDTCGVGGLTLYVNGKAWPVYSPKGAGPIVWSKRLLEESRDAVSVEITAEKVGPAAAPYTVRFKCSALKGRKDSPIRVTLEGGNPADTLEAGLGICKLNQELFAVEKDAGVMANWGIQEPAIGWVGLGVVYPRLLAVRTEDQPNEHRVVLKVDRAEPLTYSIQAAWLKGQRFDRSPTLSDWVGDLKETAKVAGLE